MLQDSSLKVLILKSNHSWYGFVIEAGIHSIKYWKLKNLCIYDKMFREDTNNHSAVTSKHKVTPARPDNILYLVHTSLG